MEPQTPFRTRYSHRQTNLNDLKHALEEAWSNCLPEEVHNEEIFKELDSKASLSDFDYLPEMELDFDPLWWLQKDKPLRY